MKRYSRMIAGVVLMLLLMLNTSQFCSFTGCTPYLMSFEWQMFPLLAIAVWLLHQPTLEILLELGQLELERRSIESIANNDAIQEHEALAFRMSLCIHWPVSADA